jgi:hypothetical protein
MLVVYPYYAGDFSLAVANLSLIADLGGVRDFPILLVTDQTTNYAQRAEVQRLAVTAFRSVETLNLDSVPQGWPVAPNVLFERAMYHCATAHPTEPVLFLEPDTTVTRPTWLREIAAAYLAHGKLFMGAVRDTYGGDGKGNRIVVGKHMVGMGVYPPGFYFQSDIIRYLHTSPAIQNARGFDISLGNEVLIAGCYDSPLFSHAWRTRNYRMEGQFIVCDRQNPEANFDEPNLRIPALIHGCKDTSVIDLVRGKSSTAISSVTQPLSLLSGKPLIDPELSSHSWKENARALQAEEKMFGPRPPEGVSGDEWQQFQAWKAQLPKTQGFATDPSLSAAELLAESQQMAQSAGQQLQQGFVSTNGMPFPSKAEVIRQRDQMIGALQAQVSPEEYKAAMKKAGFEENTGFNYTQYQEHKVAFGPKQFANPQISTDEILDNISEFKWSVPDLRPPARKPTTQAELIATRAAAGGFGEEVDAPFGLPVNEPTPVQVADVPVTRKAEASVASGSEVVAAESVDASLPATTIEIIKQADAEYDAGNALDTFPALEATRKNESIKADIRAGMAHKLLLATHSINAVSLKKLREEVKAEDLAAA